MKKNTIIILVAISLAVTACKKNDDEIANTLKSLKGEITVVDKSMLKEFEEDTEGNFLIGSGSSALDKTYFSGTNGTQISGIVFQSKTVRTGIDNGTFYVGPVSSTAANISGAVSYLLVDNAGVNALYGTTPDVKLQTMTSIIFNTTLDFPQQINIAGPLSDPSSTTYNNDVTTASSLTWNPDTKNTVGVLVEIMDVALQGPGKMILTPDDGSLSFADLWPHLPSGANNFEITIKRANWKTVTGNDGRRYRIVAQTSSYTTYSKGC